MAEKFKTTKHAEKPEWWIWEGTEVVKFGCHPDIVDDHRLNQRGNYMPNRVTNYWTVI